MRGSSTRIAGGDAGGSGGDSILARTTRLSGDELGDLADKFIDLPISVSMQGQTEIKKNLFIIFLNSQLQQIRIPVQFVLGIS
jgi:hypothetical protein